MGSKPSLLRSVRAWVYEVLANDLAGGSLHRAVSVFLIAFISLSVLAVIVQTGDVIEVRHPDGSYHPDYACTRGQMAVYVQRAFQLEPGREDAR